MIQDKFKLFIPFELEKGKEGDSDEGEMKIKGVVSTTSYDADGECLIPSGFNLKPFKDQGFFTWAHSKAPEDVVGEPMKAQIINDEFHVEGTLYKDSDRAKQIYKLAQTLKKNSSGRKLGFSLEGVAKERDEKNPKRVTKADIYNVTICTLPKNPDAYLDIAKGYIPSEVQYDIIEKGGKMILLESYDKETGELTTIDTNFKINVEKALEAGSTTGMDTVNSTTSNGASLKSESVDGVKKKKKKKLIDLTKSQVYEQLFFSIPDLQPDLAKSIFNLIQNINKQNMETVTNESLIKAFELLGVAVPEELTKGGKIKKGDGDDDSDDNQDVDGEEGGDMEKSKKKDLKKAGETQPLDKSKDEEKDKDKVEKAGETQPLDKGGVPEDGDDEEDKFNKAHSDAKKAKKKGMDKDEAKDHLKEKGHAKAHIKDALDKCYGSEMSKGLSAEDMAILLKGFQEKLSKDNEELIKGLKDELSASKTEVSEIKKSFDQYLATPEKSKAIITKTAVDRFEDPELTKGFTQMSISNRAHKNWISDVLESKFDATTGKGRDYMKAAAQLEGTGTLEKGIIDMFRVEHKINIT